MRPELAVLLFVAGSTFAQNTAFCTVYGTAHIRSFDGRSIHVGGTCTHELARTCPPRPGNVDSFAVTMRTSKGHGAGFVDVRSEAATTRMYAAGSVEINGIAAAAFSANCTHSVQRVPQGVRISLSDTGVSVLMNENGLIVVEIPRKYKGIMCGLCGNFDDNANNDPPDSPCADNDGDDPKGCLSKDGNNAFANSESLCGVFKSKAVGRTFSDCLAAFPKVAADYYESCLRDFCTSQSGFSEEGSGCASADDCGVYENLAKESSCRVAEAFAAECASRKKPDYSWRASYDCAKACPNGSRYERSTAACPPSCRSATDCQRNRPQDSWCKDLVEGCACRPGFIWSGRTCVPQKECGCLYNGIYYQNGSRWLENACKKEIQCVGGRVLSSDFRCPVLSKCKRDKDSAMWSCLCPEEYFENGAATSCVRICDAGQRPKRGVQDCEPCPFGTYQPEGKKADCLSCPPGTITTTVGSTSIKQCTAIEDALSSMGGANLSPMSDCRNSGCVQEVRVPSISFPTGLPFGRRRHRRIYVSANGILTFGASYIGNVPESLSRYTFAHPKIAAFWVRQDLQSNRSSCIASQHGYDFAKVESVKTATSGNSSDQLHLFSRLLHAFGTAPDNFRAIWALEVNWINTIPYPQSWYWNPEKRTNESLTYQLLLLSDDISTYVMFYYPKGKLRIPRTQTNQVRNIFMGFNAGDNETVFDYRAPAGFDITSLDEQSNIGRRGWWAFKVAGPSAIIETRIDGASSKCLEWYNWEKDTILMPLAKRSWHCPCDLATALNDPTFMFNGTLSCAVSMRAHAQHGFYQMCCYEQRQGPTSGTLLTDDRTAGRPIRHNPYLQPAEYLIYDNEPYQDCCIRSPYCTLYRRIRPSDKCDGYVAPKRADVFGDPHYFTFDNVGYTYGAVGEFTLVSTDSFKAQARLGAPINEMNNFVNGSVVQALAMQANRLRVHVEVNRNDVIIYISSEDNISDIRRLSSNSPVELLQYDEVSVAAAGSTAHITFENGYSAQVSAVGSRLHVSLFSPASAWGATKGLLGVNDGNVTNDFTLRNGTIVNCFLEKNFDECVHYKFGENWRIRAGESIMWYQGGKANQDYTDYSFVPKFISALTTRNFEDASFCAGEKTCVYDWLVTKSQGLANLTYHAAMKHEDAVATLGNRSPVIQGGRTSIDVTKGNPVSWSIELFDPDGDELLLLELDMPPGITNTTDGQGKYVYTWQNPSLDAINHSIRLLAVEAVGQRKRSVELVTKVRYCDGCHNGGVCAFDTEIVSEHKEVYNENVVLVACECAAGWTGYNCTVREDVCSSSPCPYTECQASNDPWQPYDCAPCPNSTINLARGVGESDKYPECFDNDECITEELACVPGTCTNTYGGYFCNCKNGFDTVHNSSSCPVIYVTVIESISFEWPRLLRDIDVTIGGDAYKTISNALTSSWTTIAGVTGITLQALNLTTKAPSAATSGLEVTYRLNCDNVDQPVDMSRILHQRSTLMTANTVNPTVSDGKRLFNISWPRYVWSNQSAILVTCRTQNACQSGRCIDILGVPKCKLPNPDTGSNNVTSEKDAGSSETDLLPIWVTVGVLAAVAAISGLSCCFVIVVRRRHGVAKLHRSRSESISTIGSNVPAPRTYRLEFPSSFSSRSSSSSGDDERPQVAAAPPRPDETVSLFGPRWPRAYISRRQHPPIPEDDLDDNNILQ